MRIPKLVIKSSLAIPYLYDKILAVFYKRAMKSCGSNVYLRPSNSDFKGLQNLSVGGTSLPKGSTIYCSKVQCKIGRNVIFDPKPTIITGYHRIDIVGKFIIDVGNDEKLSENDLPVVIEDDVWCGVNVTILKGVTIGHGNVVTAGCYRDKVVSAIFDYWWHSCQTYKMRFTKEQTEEKDKILYGET